MSTNLIIIGLGLGFAIGVVLIVKGIGLVLRLAEDARYRAQARVNAAGRTAGVQTPTRQSTVATVQRPGLKHSGAEPLKDAVRKSTRNIVREDERFSQRLRDGKGWEPKDLVLLTPYLVLAGLKALGGWLQERMKHQIRGLAFQRLQDDRRFSAGFRAGGPMTGRDAVILMERVLRLGEAHLSETLFKRVNQGGMARWMASVGPDVPPESFGVLRICDRNVSRIKGGEAFAEGRSYYQGALPRKGLYQLLGHLGGYYALFFWLVFIHLIHSGFLFLLFALPQFLMFYWIPAKAPGTCVSLFADRVVYHSPAGEIRSIPFETVGQVVWDHDPDSVYLLPYHLNGRDGRLLAEEEASGNSELFMALMEDRAKAYGIQVVHKSAGVEDWIS